MPRGVPAAVTTTELGGLPATDCTALAQAAPPYAVERVAGGVVHLADAVRRQLLGQRRPVAATLADDDRVDGHAAAGRGQRRGRR